MKPAIFEARRSYGAIFGGCQYEVLASEHGYYLQVDDEGNCYEVEFDKYDPDVCMLKNAPLIRFDRVEDEE